MGVGDRRDQGAVSLKLFRAKLAPKLVCFVLRKEILYFSEMPPRSYIKGKRKSVGVGERGGE